MKLNLLVVTSQGEFNVDQLGTLSSNLQKGDRLSLSDKNLSDPNKKVALIIYEGEDDDMVVKTLACSSALSNIIRASVKAGVPKKKIITALLKLPIIKNEKGIFLSKLPGTAETFAFDELKKEKVDFDELVAL